MSELPPPSPAPGFPPPAPAGAATPPPSPSATAIGPAPAGRHAYGRFTRFLHWSTVLALAGQFIVGYSLDDGSGRGRGRGRGRSGESGRGRGRGRGGEYDLSENRLLLAHVILGVTILVLTLVRIWWRRRTPLPPWAPQLAQIERTIVHWTERALYLSQLAMPATGLWLVFAGDDDVVGVHVAAHLLFFAAVAVHLSIVFFHTVIRRDGLIRRML